MKDKKMFKLMKEQGLFTKDDRVKCNCGRCVKLSNVIYIYPIDINYFDWWMYELKDNEKDIDKAFSLIVNKKPWGYIGHVPLLNSLIYFIHKLFHRRKYVFCIECKYCENDEEGIYPIK